MTDPVRNIARFTVTVYAYCTELEKVEEEDKHECRWSGHRVIWTTQETFDRDVASAVIELKREHSKSRPACKGTVKSYQVRDAIVPGL